MKKLIVLMLSILVFTGCKASKDTISLTNGLVIENARIISPETHVISSESYIVIENDNIVYRYKFPASKKVYGEIFRN